MYRHRSVCLLNEIRSLRLISYGLRSQQLHQKPIKSAKKTGVWELVRQMRWSRAIASQRTTVIIPRPTCRHADSRVSVAANGVSELHVVRARARCSTRAIGCECCSSCMIGCCGQPAASQLQPWLLQRCIGRSLTELAPITSRSELEWTNLT